VKRWLSRALKTAAFEPLDPKSDEERAAGFVELEATSRAEFGGSDVLYGTHALFAWRVDKLRISGQVLRAELLKWTQAFEAKNGRPAGRSEKSEQKENVRRALRSKAEPSTKTFDISLDLSTREVLIWATSRTTVEEIQGALEVALEVRLNPRVPAAFVAPEVLDALKPTALFFGELA
jgi:DNA recombination-dependent growth factor C